MDQKRIVTVEEVKDGLKFGEQTYRRLPIRTMWVTASDLRLRWNSKYKLKDEGPELSAHWHISGTARLEKDHVSIIGDPDNRTRELSISFWPFEPETYKTKDGTYAASVFLCFSKSDWEIGDEDSWWLQVYVPKETFDVLITALRNDSMVGLSVGVHFYENIYTDDWYAPPSVRVGWYLRPASDGNVDRPETAYGREANISLVEKTWTAPKPKDETEAEDTPRETETPPQPQGDLASVSTDIRRLTSSIRALGWTIVVLGILLLLFK